MTTTNEYALPLTDAVVQLTNEDGNAFAILGRVRRAILRSNHPELAEKFVVEASMMPSLWILLLMEEEQMEKYGSLKKTFLI